MSIFHDHSVSNLQTRHFVLEASNSTSEFQFFARLTFPPPPSPSTVGFPIYISPVLSTVPSILFVHISSFSAVQRIPFSFSSVAESTITFHEQRKLPSALVTAETPELLQRRRSLVSAGWRLHGHRGWLHGPEGGPGQTVVVHITRRPRSADPYSRPIHRRRAA